MVQKTHKLDIFKTLNHISKKDTNFFQQLTEEEQKAFQPLVVMRWLSGTSSSRQVYFLNELLNPLVFSMPQHKELLYNIMTVCADGQPRRYYWNKTQSKKSTSMPTAVSVIKDYYHYSTLHALEVLPLLSDEDILEYAEQLGRQKDEIAKIKKELKSRV